MPKDELAERREQNQIIAAINEAIDELKNSDPVDPDCIDWEEKLDGQEKTEEGKDSPEGPEDPEAA